jgi:hypothetical protein
MRIARFIVCTLFFCVCNADGFQRADNRQAAAWSTDVIGITEMHLSENYWIERIENAGQVLKSQREIAAFNMQLFATDPHMVKLAEFPETLTREQITGQILAISKPHKHDLFDPAGQRLGTEGYAGYAANLGLENIPASTQVRFALAVERTDMRTWPTDDRWYREQEEQKQNLDRFQENGLFPGDALAVLHTSADGEWAFVQSYNYAAWVRNVFIATGERDLVLNYKSAKDFLAVTGDKVWTAFNTRVPALSELQLDMGIRVPLADVKRLDNDLYGQNPYTSHAVLLPARDPQGELAIKPALIPRSEDVNRGYLPFTRGNIIRQAFKFLGERYGWGHSNNARDCTGFVMEVYKSFGILMPRNTGQQGSGDFGENTRFTADSTREEKLQALERMDIGDLIYVPGHVLMYIGDVDGRPYVIHDVSIFRYTDEDGEYYEGTLNSVSVTPLLPLHGTRESTYVDLMYNIKRIR